MSARVIRRLAAGTTALALTGFGLVGVASAASAIDTIPANDYFGGTFYLGDPNTGLDIAESTEAVGWQQGINALAAPGDWSSVADSVPAGADGLTYFLAPQGQESDRTKWNAYADGPLLAGGNYLGSPSPTGLANPGTGTPVGQAAVAAAGGDYSIGWAYTSTAIGNKVVNGGLFYIHIHITAGTTATATFTYERVQEEAAPLPSTTTSITSAPTSVTSGDVFSLTATVSEPTATGSVEFFNGATSLGTASVSGGTATLATATLANATTSSINASVTAVYSGDTAFAGSTSAPVTIAVAPGPIATTTAVTATSASGNENRPVVLTATVSPVSTSGAGSVVFTGSLDGAAATTIAGPIPVSATGVATTTISSLTAGDWTISAEFTGVAPYQDSASAAAASLTLAVVSVPSDQREDPQDVVVTIPEGTLAITTPYTAADPLDLGTAVLDDATSTYFTDPTVFGSVTDQAQAIQVIDRRSGGHGFTAQVRSTDFASTGDSFSASFASLTDVVAHQVTGNTLLAANVATNDIPSLSATDQPFAVHTPTAGHETGTVWFSADLALTNVPSSVQPGQYRATLTFTAL